MAVIMENSIELCFLSNKSQPPAQRIANVALENLDDALIDIYKHGGFLYLKFDNIDNQYVKELHFISNSKEFKIIALTRDLDKKRELLEWWNPSAPIYKGEVLFSDDSCDSRMVSNDLEDARKIFIEIFLNRSLSLTEMVNFRSQWDPLPH